MKKHLFTLFVLLVAGASALMASDWVLNESKYNASDKTDHIKLEVFLCDLDGSNTYCDGGTVIATNGRVSYDLLTLKYHDEASDGDAKTQLQPCPKGQRCPRKLLLFIKVDYCCTWETTVVTVLS